MAASVRRIPPTPDGTCRGGGSDPRGVAGDQAGSRASQADPWVGKRAGLAGGAPGREDAQSPVYSAPGGSPGSGPGFPIGPIGAEAQDSNCVFDEPIPSLRPGGGSPGRSPQGEGRSPAPADSTREGLPGPPRAIPGPTWRPGLAGRGLGSARGAGSAPPVGSAAGAAPSGRG